MLKISNIRVNQALTDARTIDCFSRDKKRRLNCRVYATLLYTLLLIVVMACTTHAGVADTWRSFSGFGIGLARCSEDPMNYSGVSGCETGDWSWNYVEGNRIKISTAPNQPGTIDAYWVGITGSGNVYTSSIPPGHPKYPNKNLICSSGCFYGIVGYGLGALGATTYSCQYMGVNCNTNSFWAGTGSYPSATPQPGWAAPAYHITGQTSSPAWMLVIDPADASKFPGAGSSWIHGYLPNSSTAVRVLVAGSSGEDGQPHVVMWYGSLPAYPQYIRSNGGVVIPPIVLPPVVPTVQCDTTVEGPIDLGTVDQTNAMGRTASTWLRVQCTDDATIKATVRLSGGYNNVASLGGLTIPVTFDNNTDTSSWTVSDTAPSATKLTATVTNVGTTVPGEYSQSMVVNIVYE